MKDKPEFEEVFLIKKITKKKVKIWVKIKHFNKEYFKQLVTLFF